MKKEGARQGEVKKKREWQYYIARGQSMGACVSGVASTREHREGDCEAESNGGVINSATYIVQ